MFDDDFAVARAPASRRGAGRARAPSSPRPRRRGYRNGFARPRRGRGRAARRRGARAHRARRSPSSTAASSAVETRLEAEAVEVAVAVARKLAPELIAREPLAEIAALAAELLPPAGGGAARGRCASTTRLHERARDELDEIARAARLRRPPRGAWPSPTSRPATAASNGPTAASSATGPRSRRRSPKRSARYVAARRARSRHA